MQTNAIEIVKFYMMKSAFALTLLLLVNTFLYSMNVTLPADSLTWNRLSGSGYTVYFTEGDHGEAKKLNAYLQSGIDHITRFFGKKFQDTFNVYIFPDRSSLDKQWQKDWGDSSFKSECWMIASGVAHRLDILSPNAWSKQACEHNANDSLS